MPTLDDFHALAVRVGTVQRAEAHDAAHNASIKLWIDFGDLGTLQSSAQVTDLYEPGGLVGRQVVAVTGLDPIRIAGFRSDVLVLGALTDEGVVLLSVERAVPAGSRVA